MVEPNQLQYSEPTNQPNVSIEIGNNSTAYLKKRKAKENGDIESLSSLLFSVFLGPSVCTNVFIGTVCCYTFCVWVQFWWFKLSLFGMN